MKPEPALNTAKRLGSLGAHRPRIRFGFRWSGAANDAWCRVLPFSRSWPAIAFVGLFAGGFCVPLFVVGDFIGIEVDDVFDLASTLFSLFWMLGWLSGVIILWGIFLVLLLGREVLIVSARTLELRLEVCRLGLSVFYPLSGVSGLHKQTAARAGSRRWRGRHLEFNYHGVPVGLGSDLDDRDCEELIRHITRLSGPVPAQRDGPSEPEPPRKNTPAFLSSPLQRHSVRNCRLSGLVLVFSNLVPLLGVVLLNWNIGELMLLFWLESAVIGFYNLLRMAVIGGWAVLFFGLFFVGHYGAFMAGHLLFIFSLFIQTPEQNATTLVQAGELLRVLWPAILAMIISHGVSFYTNFIRQREYHGRSIRQQMSEPYKRIILMHVTIIFGGFVVLALGAPLGALLLLIGLKLVVDLAAHRKEHAGHSTEKAARSGAKL